MLTRGTRLSLAVLAVPAILWGTSVLHTGACAPESASSATNGAPRAKTAGVPHTADQNGDGLIGLSELLRIIQFFAAGGLHCQEGTEDGYAPGPGGDQSCGPHASDYDPQDWAINLGELLRLIQFFNSGGYRSCDEGTEDGYCVGGPPINVVLMVLDALRDDTAGGQRNGIPITPFLEACAARGARFTRASVPATWTRPSMAALFSGLYPDVLQGDEDTPMQERFIVPEGMEVLAEWLARHGYDTWAVQTNGNAGPAYGLAQGFAEDQYSFIGNLPAGDVNEVVRANMNAWTEPFFVFAHYIDPHEPYAPPPEYDDFFGPQPYTTLYDDYVLQAETWRQYNDDIYFSWLNGTVRQWTPISDNAVEALRYRYDAESRYMDDELAKIVAEIEARFPRTIFIFLADHGEALLERDVAGHGTSLYEEQARIPLIFFGPGIAHQVIGHPVDALGLMPTLAKLLRLPANPEWEGRDLFAPAPAGEPVFSFTLNRFLNGASVLVGDFKLIEHSHYPSPQLFNLAQDPEEAGDLASALPEKVAELTSILRAHQGALVSRYVAPDAPIPPEVLEQLEALGYFNDTEVAPETR